MLPSEVRESGKLDNFCDPHLCTKLGTIQGMIVMSSKLELVRAVDERCKVAYEKKKLNNIHE